MAAEAARGLQWREEHNRGGTAVGVARARDISNRANLSKSTIKRMVSYFARHEVDKGGKGFSPGEEGYPSPGRIAWALWGGNSGKSWANAKARQIDNAKGSSKTDAQSKAASISDWMRGDNEGLDWRWGLLGPSMVGLPVGMAAQVYGGKVIPRVAGAPKDLNERRLYRSLLESAKGLKVDVVPEDASKTKMMMNNRPSLLNQIRSMLGATTKPRTLGSSLYNPMLKEVVMVKGMKAPGVLAHELGHAVGGKGMMVANVLGKQGLGIGTLMSLLSNNKSDGENSALVGTALGGGLLASELDASRRGYRMLRDLGSGRKAALKSFIGIPAYLAAAATPLLAHHTKSRLGGYDTEKRASNNDE
jgi:hypothetical protein